MLGFAGDTGARAWAAAVLAAVAVAGCGSSGSKQSSSAATPTATTQTAATPKADGPRGKLSPAEYAQIHAAALQLTKLTKAPDLARAIKAAAPACDKVTAQTALAQSFHVTCVQAFKVFTRLSEVKTRKAECDRAAQAGDVSCYSNIFRAIGRAANVSRARERALNAELARRGIKGRCRDELGSSRKDLAAESAIGRDAIAAAHAAEARNGGRFQAAVNRLDADFGGLEGESPQDSLRKLKSCR